MLTDAYTCVTNTLTTVRPSRRSPVPLPAPHATSGLLPATGVGFAGLELPVGARRSCPPGEAVAANRRFGRGGRATATAPSQRGHMLHPVAKGSSPVGAGPQRPGPNGARNSHTRVLRHRRQAARRGRAARTSPRGRGGDGPSSLTSSQGTPYHSWSFCRRREENLLLGLFGFQNWDRGCGLVF